MNKTDPCRTMCAVDIADARKSCTHSTVVMVSNYRQLRNAPLPKSDTVIRLHLNCTKGDPSLMLVQDMHVSTPLAWRGLGRR